MDMAREFAFAVCKRINTVFFSERAGKIAHLRKAAPKADLLHPQVGRSEQFLCSAKPNLFEILNRCRVKDSLKAAHAFCITDISCRSYISYSDIIREMLLYVEEHFFDPFLFTQLLFRGREHIVVPVAADLQNTI